MRKTPIHITYSDLTKEAYLLFDNLLRYEAPLSPELVIEKVNALRDDMWSLRSLATRLRTDAVRLCGKSRKAAAE